MCISLVDYTAGALFFVMTRPWVSSRGAVAIEKPRFTPASMEIALGADAGSAIF